MATQNEVNTYINVLRQELSYYGDRIAIRTQHGHNPLFAKKVKFALLQAYTEIVERYLNEWDDTANNMFNVAAFNDIQQHVNRIGNSFHWIDLS